MIWFYDINKDYIEFLKKVDPKVPNISYTSNDKFLCGVVLEIHGIKYYAPVSHNQTIFRTSFPIYDIGAPNSTIPISTIRFSFMVPAIDSVLEKKDIKQMRSSDPQYASLVFKEWEYCRRHEPEILRKALQVYKAGCNPTHFLHDKCCNFPALEQHYLKFTQ